MHIALFYKRNFGKGPQPRRRKTIIHQLNAVAGCLIARIPF